MPQPGVVALRIVAWNIRAGGGVRAERIASQLLRWRPTLVVLSEFRNTPPSRRLSALLSDAGFVHQKATASADRPSTNALLVASLWPLRALPAPFAANEPHRWLPVRVCGPEPLILGALHTPNKASGRKYAFHDAVVSVAKSWKRSPAIILGDTNSGLPGLDEEVPCFGRGEQAFFESIDELGWTDAFRHVRGRARAYTWYSPNGGNGFRLDQGFVNRALLPRLSKVSYRWGGGRHGGLSDHAAILIDLSESAAA